MPPSPSPLKLILELSITVQKKPVHQINMPATSKNVLCSGHNHLLSTGMDDPTLWSSAEHQGDNQWKIISTGGLQRGFDLGNRTFLEVASTMVT